MTKPDRSSPNNCSLEKLRPGPASEKRWKLSFPSAGLPNFPQSLSPHLFFLLPLLLYWEPGIKAPYGKHLAGHLRLIALGNVLTFIEMWAVMSQTCWGAQAGKVLCQDREGGRRGGGCSGADMRAGGNAEPPDFHRTVIERKLWWKTLMQV